MDQTYQSHALISSQPVLTSVEASAKTSATSGGPTVIKLKVADPLRDSLGLTQKSTDMIGAPNLREKLNKARSIIIDVSSCAKIVMDRNVNEALRAHLELLLTRTADAFTAADSLLEMNGNVLGLSNHDPPSTSVSSGKTTLDATTDMELTPGFWDSQASITLASRRKRTPKVPASQFPPETEADTAMKTDTEDWSKVQASENNDCGGLARRPPITDVGVFKQGTSYSRQER